jgi:hypothetical protein
MGTCLGKRRSDTKAHLHTDLKVRDGSNTCKKSPNGYATCKKSPNGYASLLEHSTCDSHQSIFCSSI